jgi:thiol-disulfide isomerase/thioredoxin
MKIHQIAIVLGLLVSISACTKTPPTAEQVLLDANEKLLSINNAEYDITYSIKHLTETDTAYFHAHTRHIKQENDTFFGAVFSVKQDSAEHIYAGDTFAVIISHQERGFFGTPAITGIGPIRGNIANSMLYKPFIEGLDTAALFADSVEMSLTMNESTYQVDIKFPDDEERQNRTKSYFINKKSHLIERLEASVTWMEMDQHIIIELKNVVINSDDIRPISTTIPKGYETKNTDLSANKPRILPLANGVRVPNFNLEKYTGGSLDLYKSSASLTLLDFWYMGCGPCQMSIPHLIELRENYSEDQLLILGINQGDRNDIEKTRDFFKKKDITYPSVISNKSIDSMYHVTGYPTYYLLDGDKNIISSQIGFGENSFHEIDSLIEARLKSDE